MSKTETPLDKFRRNEGQSLMRMLRFASCKRAFMNAQKRVIAHVRLNAHKERVPYANSARVNNPLTTPRRRKLALSRPKRLEALYAGDINNFGMVYDNKLRDQRVKREKDDSF